MVSSKGRCNHVKKSGADKSKGLELNRKLRNLRW